MEKLFFFIDEMLRKIASKIGDFPLLYAWIKCHRIVVNKKYRAMLNEYLENLPAYKKNMMENIEIILRASR